MNNESLYFPDNEINQDMPNLYLYAAWDWLIKVELP